MSFLKLYEFFIGSKVDFLKPYQGEEQDALYRQASIFWDKLDSCAIVYVLFFVMIGGAMALCYYKPFNNKPGRHYLPKYWLIMSACCAIVCFLFTLGLAVEVAGTNFRGTLWLEFKLAILNAFYSWLIYLVTSVICCKCLKTNAYKLF